MREPVAKKSLGQHWLNDQSVLTAICESAEIASGDNVLEIGPGKGSLTQVLLDMNAHVVAVEFDPEAVEYLQQIFRHTPREQLQITQGDIRTFDLTQLPSDYKIVANIPYYLTSHLIQIISETKNRPRLATLLIQKEVAQRVCATPGQMSLLSVSAQFYWQVSLDIEVPASLFTPPPKVDSQVLVLKRRDNPLFEVDTRLFFRLVKAGFASKRKTLINSLSGGLRQDKSTISKLLNDCYIDPQKRPQELSLDDWHTIYQAALANSLFV